MKSVTLLMLLVLFVQSHTTAQEVFQLHGKAVVKTKAIEGVHIVNLSTSQGTISSDFGLFNLPVSLGDTLLFSSLAHENLRVEISKNTEQTKFIRISLTPKTVALDEIKLTGLTGNLEHDLQRQPSETQPKIGWNYTSQDLQKKLPSDDLMNQSKVNAENFVNPIQGGGAGIGLPDKRLLREQQLKRTLKLKKDFPDILIKEFGILYFTQILGVTKEDIPGFISFCEPMGIFEKFQNRELLELIEILKTESTHYHELED